MGGQRHASAALPPGKTRYPLYGKLGEPQCRSGQMRKSRPHRDSITGPSMIVPNVSKIYNFLQSGIKTLRTSKPVTGNNISNCLSLSLSLSLLPNQTVRLWAQPCTLPFSGDQNILSLSEAVGGEASDPPQSNARIKNQRELYLYAFCIHSLCVNGHCTCTSTLKC